MFQKKKKEKKRDFVDSLNDALRGIIDALTKERNIKIDFVIGILILIASLIFGLNRTEIILICLTIGLVIFAEMTNTCIEKTVDMISKKYSEEAKQIKDMAAGAVLIVAMIAVIVGYGLFFDKINVGIENTLTYLSELPLHISFLTLMIVTMCVIFIKAVTKTGTFLRGGLPSGHAAIASAIVMIVWLLTKNIIIFLLTTILMLLVIHSRVEAKIHSVKESILGVILGFSISLVIVGLCKYFGII